MSINEKLAQWISPKLYNNIQSIIIAHIGVIEGVVKIK